MKRGLKTAAALLCLTLAFWFANTSISLALGSAKVVAQSGIIREKASKDSTKLASVMKGNKLDVISQTSDSNGYTWYKVYIDGEKTGYVRADVVTVEGTIPTESASNSDSNTSSSESNSGGGNVTVVGSNNSTTTTTENNNSADTPAINVSPTDVASAKTISEVRVREGVGTDTDTVTTAKKDTTVTVSGVAADSDGKNWYQVSYSSGDKTINGFIREDFLEVLERVEVPAEEVPEDSEPAAEEVPIDDATNAEYGLEYKTNAEGVGEWYLNDNVQGTSQSLAQLLDVAKQAENGELVEAKAADNMKKIVIALVAALIILVIAVTVLGFKLHDAYEYEYEDEEEDEAEEEEVIVRAPRKDTYKKNEAKVNEAVPAKESRVNSSQPEAPAEEEPEEAPVLQKPVKESKKSWQSKDFLELDDDMEFEFLDL